MTAQGGDLLAWLNDAIARREKTAQAAGALQDDPENGWGIVDNSGYAEPSKRRYISPHIGLTHEPESAAHIVLNNPADVLRRCAADRKLLAIHQKDGYGSYCTVCTGEETFDDDSDGNREFSRPAMPFPCDTVLALAEGYGWTEGER